MMNLSRDPHIDLDTFADRAEVLLRAYELPKFHNPSEAVPFIQVADAWINKIQQQFRDEGFSFTESILFDMGSTLGEAFRVAFIGHWYFSIDQNRWVVRISMPLSEPMDVNIFNKVEKRFVNGEEDSITYMFEMIKKMYVEQAEKL